MSTQETMDEASTRYGEEYFWLGDASGFTVEAYTDPYTRRPYPVVEHRCGWSVRLEGTARYLANLIEDHVRRHGREGCRRETR